MDFFFLFGLFVFKNHCKLMHFNLFNMIQSIATVIFTAMQIIQSLAMWNIFKLAFKLL